MCQPTPVMLGLVTCFSLVSGMLVNIKGTGVIMCGLRLPPSSRKKHAQLVTGPKMRYNLTAEQTKIFLFWEESHIG